MSITREGDPSLSGNTPEFVSGGASAKVYASTAEQRARFPHAQVTRDETSRDITWAQRFYLRMRIAGLLFPGEVIEVVGWELDPPLETSLEELSRGFVPEEPKPASKPILDDDLDFVPEIPIGAVSHRKEDTLAHNAFPVRTHRVFSKLADVPSGHATFSAHATRTIKHAQLSGYNPNPHRLHDCEPCNAHADFHTEHGLYKKAREFDWRVHIEEKMGLWFPNEDPTDYCLTRDGKLIFFELGGMYEPDVRAYLERQAKLTETQAQAFPLLDELANINRFAQGAHRSRLSEFRLE